MSNVRIVTRIVYRNVRIVTRIVYRSDTCMLYLHFQDTRVYPPIVRLKPLAIGDNSHAGVRVYADKVLIFGLDDAFDVFEVSSTLEGYHFVLSWVVNRAMHGGHVVYDSATG